MDIVILILIFVGSLVALVKGADFLLQSAERVGLALGLSPFVVGVVIVGLGTSFPELVTGIASILQGAPEIVAANAIGSNIANILLVVGVSAIVAEVLRFTKNLIDIELPLLVTATTLFFAVAYDEVITRIESVLLVASFIVYLLYTFLHRPDDEIKVEKIERPKISHRDYLYLILGIAGLVLGAKYLIQSVISISDIIGIGTGAIALVAVAIGTSLPELIVSVKAAIKRNAEVAIGNIFGSNAFNLLFVVGLPGLFSRLPLDADTKVIALPALVIVTFLFLISGISKRIYLWEGVMYLILYVLFVGKLFAFI